MNTSYSNIIIVDTENSEVNGMYKLSPEQVVLLNRLVYDDVIDGEKFMILNADDSEFERP